MTPQDAASSEAEQDVRLWEPQQALRRIRVADAALSSGFLRCRPEKWFPGFSSHWLHIAHSLGIEARLIEVKPLLERPPVADIAYVGTAGGEDIVLAMESASAESLAEELVPGAGRRASQVVLEYILRRFLASLAKSWSGPESLSVTFDRRREAVDVDVVASVKASFTINNMVPLTIWVGIQNKMVQTFDSLWRKQVQLLSKVSGGPSLVRLELAQLGVPPQMLSDYLLKGTVIDLEIGVSDGVTLKLGSKAWMPGRLVDVGGMFGCEMSPGALTVPAVAEGATQLSVEFGSLPMESTQLAELAQSGAVLVTKIPVSNLVQLVINQEKVADARLCVYEGRFAIEVQ